MVAPLTFSARQAVLAPLLAVVLWTIAATPARAAGPDESTPNPAALADLQQHAQHAQRRDQCYLYAQLVHDLTVLAGRQMAAGENEKAALTIAQVDAMAAEIGKSARDAKRLKNSEQLLEQTTHRLTDMARVAAEQQRVVIQAALRHLEAVHSSVLALVFAE